MFAFIMVIFLTFYSHADPSDADRFYKVIDEESAKRLEMFSPSDRIWNSKENCQTLAGVKPIQLPWRDQGQRAWCFANAAADLATIACGRTISVSDIALRAAKYQNKDIDKGGSTFWALKNSEKKGFCSEDNLPQKPFADLAVEELDSRIRAIEKSARLHSPTCVGLSAAMDLFGQSKQTAQILQRAGGKDVLARLADDKCRPRIKCSKSFRGEYVFSEAPSQVKLAMAILFEQLKNGRPAAVGLDFFQMLTSTSQAELRKQNSKSEEPLQARHALTAIGLSFNSETGKCMAKLRNSWGGSCDGLDQTKVKCDLESIWMPMDMIAEEIRELAYLFAPGINEGEKYELIP